MTLFLFLFVVAIVGVLMVWFIISDVKEKDCLNDFLSELRIKESLKKSPANRLSIL